MEDRKRLIFYFTPTVKAALGVEEYHSLSVGVGGDTGHCGAAQIEHVTVRHAVTLYFGRERNDRPTSA